MLSVPENRFRNGYLSGMSPLARVARGAGPHSLGVSPATDVTRRGRVALSRGVTTWACAGSVVAVVSPPSERGGAA